MIGSFDDRHKMDFPHVWLRESSKFDNQSPVISIVRREREKTLEHKRYF